MKNFEYITASLPVLSLDASGITSDDLEETLSDIRSQLDSRDLRVFEQLLSGFDSDSLCEGFYREALSGSDAFIKGYFAFDLALRNAKVRYLNSELGRPADTDVIVLGDEEEEFEETDTAQQVLHTHDILEREKGLDRMYWKKAEELTCFNYFDIDAVLGFTVKLCIIRRWLALDEETGRELFRKMVRDIRGTYDEIRFEDKNQQ